MSQKQCEIDILLLQATNSSNCVDLECPEGHFQFASLHKCEFLYLQSVAWSLCVCRAAYTCQMGCCPFRLLYFIQNLNFQLKSPTEFHQAYCHPRRKTILNNKFWVAYTCISHHYDLSNANLNKSYWYLSQVKLEMVTSVV